MSDNSTTNNKKDNNDIYKEELKYFVKNPKSIYRTIEEVNAEKLFWKIYIIFLYRLIIIILKMQNVKNGHNI